MELLENSIKKSIGKFIVDLVIEVDTAVLDLEEQELEGSYVW